MLGAATPTQSLVRAVRETAPAALVLWSQRPGQAGPHILQLLSPYPPRLFTAGPGWTLDGPAGVAHLASLTQALAALAADTARAAGARCHLQHPAVTSVTFGVHSFSALRRILCSVARAFTE